VGLQTQLSDTGASWINGAGIGVHGEPLDLLDASVAYQYSVCLNWAVGMIALASVDTVPSNMAERLLFAFVMMTAFLFGSALVSLLSARVIDFRMSRRDKETKLRTVRRYLVESNTHHHIALAIIKQAQQRLSIQAKLNESDVPALKLLSRALISQLRFDISRASFECHPLFRFFISLEETSMQRMCSEAATSRHLPANDEVFGAGSEGVAAFVASHGTLQYKQESFRDAPASGGRREGSLFGPCFTTVDSGSAPVREVIKTVDAGSWVSEAALWVEWTHTGRLESVGESRIFIIDAERMWNALPNPGLRAFAAQYAVEFHRRVVSAKPPLASYPSDLEVPYADFCGIVSCMEPPLRVQVGLRALRMLTKEGWFGKASASQMKARLKHEIVSGKSVLVITGQGLVQRAVSVVALRLVSPSGRLFVRIGSIGDASPVPRCQLPGVKQDEGETVDETLERLLKSRMRGLLADKVELSQRMQEITEVADPELESLGIRTRCVRAVVSATIKAGKDSDALGIGCRLADARAPTSGSEGLPFSPSRPSRRVSVGRSGEQSQFCSELLQRTVWAVPRSSEAGQRAWECFAWLEPDEFDYLKASCGEPVLAYWLSLLVPPDTGATSSEYEMNYARPNPSHQTRGSFLDMPAG